MQRRLLLRHLDELLRGRISGFIQNRIVGLLAEPCTSTATKRAADNTHEKLSRLHACAAGCCSQQQLVLYMYMCLRLTVDVERGRDFIDEESHDEAMVSALPLIWPILMHSQLLLAVSIHVVFAVLEFGAHIDAEDAAVGYEATMVLAQSQDVLTEIHALRLAQHVLPMRDTLRAAQIQRSERRHGR